MSEGYYFVPDYDAWQGFEPNYETWWNKEDVNELELNLVAQGIEPQKCEEVKKIYAKSEANEDVSDEECGLVKAYRSYANFLKTLQPMSMVTEASVHVEWKGSKEQFVLDAYDLRFPLHPNFVKFLEGKSIVLNTYDSFKNHAQYLADWDTYTFQDVKTELAAFCLLLGLEPEFFEKYYDLQKLRAQDFSWKRLTPEQRYLDSEYSDFLYKKYHNLGSVFYDYIEEAYEFSATLDIWEGDFEKYVQALHDEGFIFKKETYEWLKNNGLKFEYSENSWALRFYNRWIKEGIWSTEESISLFEGESPNKYARNFFDFSQNKRLITGDIYGFQDFGEFDCDILNRLKKHVAASLLDGVVLYNGQNYFRPENITKWLLEHALYEPPRALLQSLFGKEEGVRYQATPEKQREIEEASQKIYRAEEMPIKPAHSYRDEFYENSLAIWAGYHKEHDRLPTRRVTATLLKNKHNYKWTVATIERELSADVLKDNYERCYKQDRA